MTDWNMDMMPMRELNLDKMSLLYDYYGGLLTDRQNEVYKLYHEDNLSLTEIADEYKISKQAVSTILKKSRMLLLGYEAKLGLIAKHYDYSRTLTSIDEKIANMMNDVSVKKSDMSSDLKDIKKLISALDY